MGGAPALLVAAVAMLVAYGPILDNGFCLDDRGIVLGNRLLVEGAWGELLASSYWYGVTGVDGGLYRPLALAALALEWIAFGVDPQGYHLVSVLLQLIAATVLIAAVRRALTAPAAVLAGFMLCLHPAATEVVNAVVGTADLLGFVLGLGGAALLVDGRTRTRAAAGAGLLALAPLAKESAVVFAAGAVVAGLLHRRLHPWTAASVTALALGAVCVRWAITGHLGAGGVGFLDNPLAFGDLSARLVNAPSLAVRYLLLAAFPWPLSADYSYDQIRLVPSPLSADFLAPASVFGSAAILLVPLVRSHRQTAFWSGVCAATLAISCHILLPIGTLFAERLAYPLIAAACVVVGWTLTALGQRRGRVAVALAAGWLGIFALLDRDRTRDWRHDGSLFESAVARAPRSARSHFGLGHWRHAAQDLPGALDEYDLALAIFPRYTDALYNRGAALLSLGRPKEALSSYLAATRTRPGHVQALYAAAALLESLDGPLAAVSAFEEVLRVQPSHEEGARGLARGLIALGREERARWVLGRAFGDRAGQEFEGLRRTQPSDREDPPQTGGPR